MGRFPERVFHHWLERRLSAGRGGLLPMGDDVAAMRVGGERLLLTTDALTEGTHFLPTADPRAIGRAAVAVSLSDIASKGGRPIAVLIDLLLPPSTPIGWAKKVLDGAEGFAVHHGCHVVGGDTKAAAGRSVVGTIVGLAGPGPLPSRGGARPGDQLIVTGSVGRGGRLAGSILGRRHPGRRASDALLDVRPRIAEGRALARYARAMIDTSDGLADAAQRLARASKVRVGVNAERLPLDPPLRGIEPARHRLRMALYGGDYELLAAVPGPSVARALRAVRGAGTAATVVGRVERGRGAYLFRDGRRRRMPDAGWDPFAPPRRWMRRAGTAHSAR